MFWLFLLGVATILGIALRRVLRKQKPLNDELYSKAVAVEHVHSGVAWVRGDGRFGSVNHAFASAFELAPEDFPGRAWYEVFSRDDRQRLREAYDQALLMGITNVETDGSRADGAHLHLNVRLVIVHDHKMRMVGFHCLIDDRTREREMEERLSAMLLRNRELEDALLAVHPEPQMQQAAHQLTTPEPLPPNAQADVLRFMPRSGPVSAAAVVRRAIQRMGSPVVISR